jgi:release factor glutamine methyltransferase
VRRTLINPTPNNPNKPSNPTSSIYPLTSDASTPRRAQVTRGGIAAAWAGGKDGREVVDRLLPDVADVLSPDGGTMLMILLEQNKPREVMVVLERAGLRCDVVRSASADEERLHVLRAVKGGDR